MTLFHLLASLVWGLTLQPYCFNSEIVPTHALVSTIEEEHVQRTGPVIEEHNLKFPELTRLTHGVNKTAECTLLHKLDQSLGEKLGEKIGCLKVLHGVGPKETAQKPPHESKLPRPKKEQNAPFRQDSSHQLGKDNSYQLGKDNSHQLDKDNSHQPGCKYLNQAVCGSDGKTYKNRCMLAAKACKDKSNLVEIHEGECACVEYCPLELRSHEQSNKQNISTKCQLLKTQHSACPLNYSPVCGSDGKTHSNECLLEVEACKSGSDLVKRHDGKCEEGTACPKAHNVACKDVCPLNYSPVCGSDGKTYSNDCLLELEACKSQSDLGKRHDGKCEEGTARPPSCDSSSDLSGDPAFLFHCAVKKSGTITCSNTPSPGFFSEKADIEIQTRVSETGDLDNQAPAVDPSP